MQDLNRTTSADSNTEHTQDYSLAGAVYAAVPAGVIRIGHTVDAPGAAKMPMASDQFRVTLPIKQDGDWVAHPIDSRLRERSTSSRLSAIPVRVMFDDPSLAMRSRLEAYDPRSRQLVCAGQGNGQAVRRTVSGLTTVQCDGCHKCAFANQYGPESICKPLGRLSVQIDGHDDPLEQFVLRTSSYHSQRNLEAKLRQYSALFGGLRGLPMQLRLIPMQSELSNWETFFVLDLKLAASLGESLKAVGQQHKDDESSGLNIAALESAVRRGLANGGVFGDVASDIDLELTEFGFVHASAYKSDSAASMPHVQDEVGQLAADVIGSIQAGAAKAVSAGTCSEVNTASSQTLPVTGATHRMDTAQKVPDTLAFTSAEKIFDHLDDIQSLAAMSTVAANGVAKEHKERASNKPVVQKLGRLTGTAASEPVAMPSTSIPAARGVDIDAIHPDF